MPTYLMLSTLTPQGVQTLKANPSRLREVNQDVEELGAKVLHQWATLVIVFVLSRVALAFLLREQADNAIRAAVFVADVVVSPLLFLGAALLYFDQAARVSRTSERKRSAGGVDGTSRA